MRMIRGLFEFFQKLQVIYQTIIFFFGNKNDIPRFRGNNIPFSLNDAVKRIIEVISQLRRFRYFR